MKKVPNNVTNIIYKNFNIEKRVIYTFNNINLLVKIFNVIQLHFIKLNINYYLYRSKGYIQRATLQISLLPVAGKSLYTRRLFLSPLNLTLII